MCNRVDNATLSGRRNLESSKSCRVSLWMRICAIVWTEPAIRKCIVALRCENSSAMHKLSENLLSESWSSGEICLCFQLLKFYFCCLLKMKSLAKDFQIVPYIFKWKEVKIRESWFWIMVWKVTSENVIFFHEKCFDSKEKTQNSCSQSSHRAGKTRQLPLIQTVIGPIMHEILKFSPTVTHKKKQSLPFFLVSLWSFCFCSVKCFKTQDRCALVRMYIECERWNMRNELVLRTKFTSQRTLHRTQSWNSTWNWFILSYDPILPLAELRKFKFFASNCGGNFNLRCMARLVQNFQPSRTIILLQLFYFHLLSNTHISLTRY